MMTEIIKEINETSTISVLNLAQSMYKDILTGNDDLIVDSVKSLAQGVFDFYKFCSGESRWMFVKLDFSWGQVRAVMFVEYRVNVSNEWDIYCILYCKGCMTYEFIASDRK